MAIKYMPISPFARYTWTSIGMLVAIAIYFVSHVLLEKKIDYAKGIRYQSVLLLSEYRQSLDEQRRMALTYVATGNPVYKKQYQNIVDIREGNQVRPKRYNEPYLGFVIKEKMSSERPIALLDLIRQEGFSEQEYRKLKQADSRFIEVNATEQNAMQLIEAAGSDVDARRARATQILQNENYQQAIAGIMKSINDVSATVTERSLNAAKSAEAFSAILKILAILFTFAFVFTGRKAYLALKTQLGGSIDEVQKHLTRISNGNLLNADTVTEEMDNSALACLTRMQASLIEKNREQKRSEKYEHLRNVIFEQLASDEPLLNILKVIVRGVEKLNPEMTCTIMLLDPESKFFNKCVSSDLPIFFRTAISRVEIGVGFGSCSAAVFTGERVVVENIATHPYWITLKEIAAQARFGACCSQPIRSSSGELLGTFAIYHHELHEHTKFDLSVLEQSARLAGIAIERKMIEQNLQIAAIAFESQEGMLVTDANRVILRVNSACTQITGYPEDEIIGKHPGMLSSGRHDMDFYANMWESIVNTGSWEGEVWNRRKNGEVYPAHLTFTAVKGRDGTTVNYVATLVDITSRKSAEEEIQHLAYYDSLTGLPNRRLLMDRLSQALVTSARGKGGGAILFLDLDHFKTLNDTLGHDVGDLLLKQVSERLTSCVREGDTVARIGGDEFVVMLEGLSDSIFEAARQAEVICEKILTALNQAYHLNTYEYHSTTSIGATLFNGHEVGSDELLKQADIAMYQSKTAGRNAIRFFDPVMQEVINNRAVLERELHKAFDNNQFQLHYQLQVNNLGQALGAEALIRWMHPERGMVLPFHFISLAEEIGLILPIGKWVIETACAQLKLWQQSTYTRDIVLSINVSAKQFRQADFVEQVQDAVSRHDINPSLLKLELTESLLLEDVEEIIVTMTTLREIGVQFSLDDFGTGYSSLMYLKRLPLNQLKIDQSFVRDLITDISDQAIVHTIIAMAKSLSLDIIAEGVETEEQLQFLLNKGCTSYQGYLFSRPLPIMQFEELLKMRGYEAEQLAVSS
jgi:diguanylate cyclase (GGDEF)-like protein/PAS domain S-box-containing protein